MKKFWDKVTPAFIWGIMIAIISLAMYIGHYTTRINASELMLNDHEDRLEVIEPAIQRIDTNIEWIKEEIRNE